MPMRKSESFKRPTKNGLPHMSNGNGGLMQMQSLLKKQMIYARGPFSKKLQAPSVPLLSQANLQPILRSFLF